MAIKLSSSYMHFGNGGLSCCLVFDEGVLGIEMEHHQFGVPSLKTFMPLMYDEKYFKHHFDRSYTSNGAKITPVKNPNDNSNNDTIINWLSPQLSDIIKWLENNPKSTISEYAMVNQLSNIKEN